MIDPKKEFKCAVRSALCETICSNFYQRRSPLRVTDYPKNEKRKKKKQNPIAI